MPADFEGIDSRRYSDGAYPSAMNDNSPSDAIRYSAGEAGQSDFDDWEHIENNLNTPATYNIDRRNYTPSD